MCSYTRPEEDFPYRPFFSNLAKPGYAGSMIVSDPCGKDLTSEPKGHIEGPKRSLDMVSVSQLTQVGRD